MSQLQAEREETPTSLRRDALILSTLIASLLTTAVMLLFSEAAIQEFCMAYLHRVNLVQYAVMFIIFIAAFLITYLIVRKRRLTVLNRVDRKIWVIITCLFVAILTIVSFLNEAHTFATEADHFPWHQTPLPLLLVICAVVLAIFFLLARHLGWLNARTSRGSTVAFIAVSILVALCSGYANYQPNIDDAVALFNIDAYCNSIYFVYHHVPYGAELGSIYGHYALLVTPVLRAIVALTGWDITYALIVLASVATGVIFLIFAYVISAFVDDDCIRILGIVASALTYASMRLTIYYQLMPHRTLVIAVLLLLVTLVYKHPHRLTPLSIIGYVFAALSIVWSVDMGLFAAATWTFFLMAVHLQHHDGRTALRVIAQPLFLILALIASYGLVWGYNASLGAGRQRLGDFLFPIVSDSFMTGLLQVPLIDEISAWMLIALIMFAFFGYGLLKVAGNVVRGTLDLRSTALLAITAMALCSYSYAINRPAYFNLDVVYPIIVLFLCLMAQAGVPTASREGPPGDIVTYTSSGMRGIDIGFSLSVVSLLVLLALAGVCYYPVSNSQRAEYRDTTDLAQTVAAVERNVPEGTKALGIGADELYMIMGRDPQLYAYDHPDITYRADFLAYADEVLRESADDDLFISETMLDTIRSIDPDGCDYFMSTHTVRFSHMLGDHNLVYCVANGWNPDGV